MIIRLVPPTFVARTEYVLSHMLIRPTIIRWKNHNVSGRWTDENLLVGYKWKLG